MIERTGLATGRFRRPTSAYVACGVLASSLQSATQRSRSHQNDPNRTSFQNILRHSHLSSCALANGERQFHFAETVCLLTGIFSFSAHAQTHVQQFDELEHELEWSLESLGVLLAPRERTYFAPEHVASVQWIRVKSRIGQAGYYSFQLQLHLAPLTMKPTVCR
jgi:hypothetical protein